MPLVGMLVSKVDPRQLIGAGLLIGAWTLLWLGKLNLHAGYWDIFWPQFIQGGEPRSHLRAVDDDQHGREPVNRMGNATSLFSLMRNVGASIGVP